MACCVVTKIKVYSANFCALRTPPLGIKCQVITIEQSCGKQCGWLGFKAYHFKILLLSSFDHIISIRCHIDDNNN